MPQQVQNSVPQLPIDLNMEEVKAQVDEIFELAQSNSWEHEQFAKKILSGCVACNLGYVAIAMALRAPQATNSFILSQDLNVKRIIHCFSILLLKPAN